MSEPRRVTVIPGPLDVAVQVPGSKSIANRALVCAALADGESVLSNVPDGDDTVAMVDCLNELGWPSLIAGTQVTITGTGGTFIDGPRRLHAGLAGTTSRFVTAVAALAGSPITIDGLPPLRSRPFEPLHEALQQLGVQVTPEESFGHLPAVVEGPPTSGTVEIRGDVSSQYITALMLIGPFLPDGLRLELTTALISRPYVEMTAAVMAAFGVDDVVVDEREVSVAAGRYVPTLLTIEPDASSASYPLALAPLLGGSVTVSGLGREALQGDARFGDLLAEMGCRVDWSADSVTVASTSRLSGIDVDMADVSDLVPTMAVVASFADTPSRIRGVGFIRGKESDRLGDLARELRHLGVDIDETDDGLDIRPSTDSLHGGQVGTHHDHRLAMAFGVLGAAVGDVVVEDPDVVSKSWPGFWSMLDGLRT